MITCKIVAVKGQFKQLWKTASLTPRWGQGARDAEKSERKRLQERHVGQVRCKRAQHWGEAPQGFFAPSNVQVIAQRAVLESPALEFSARQQMGVAEVESYASACEQVPQRSLVRWTHGNRVATCNSQPSDAAVFAGHPCPAWLAARVGAVLPANQTVGSV